MHGGHIVRALCGALSISICASIAACDGGPDAADGDQSDIGEVQQAAKVCAAGTRLPGIDVSTYQGRIDWNAVKNAGIKFAVIRASHGAGIQDDTFAYNWSHAKSAGVVRGAYHYFQPEQDVNVQANQFVQIVGQLEPGDLPPVLDVESTGGLTATQVANKVHKWLTIVEPALGRTPMIYTGKYFWQDNVGSADETASPLWVAQWGVTCPDLPSPWTSWKFHQTSDNGRVAGINAAVDTDVFNGTMDDLLAMGAPPVCGDGVCSGGETTDSCMQDCPPCQTIGADGDVVDDDGACFEAGGDPQFMRHEKAGWDSTLTWTHATEFDQTYNYGVWHFYLAEAGRYKVEAYTPAPYSMSKMAAYQLNHAGKTVSIDVDQTAVDGWQDLGDYAFAAGGGQSIRLNDNTGETQASNTQLVFDAIRLTRLDNSGGDATGGDGSNGSDGTDPTDPASGNMTSGCAAGGTGSGPAATWLVIMGAALAGVGRRRRRRSDRRPPKAQG